MKTIARFGVVTLLSTVIFAVSATSQELALNTSKKEKTFSVPQHNEPSGEICSIDNVTEKVLKSFHRSFGKRPDAVWVKSSEGFVAQFKDQKRSTYVYLSPNGSIDYQMNRYFEEVLPEDVRHLVKSNFYDYAITHISEIHKGDFILYFVKIENKASIKTIRVVSDEYTVVEDFIKQ